MQNQARDKANVSCLMMILHHSLIEANQFESSTQKIFSSTLKK
jgi:hypothetical protein